MVGTGGGGSLAFIGNVGGGEVLVILLVALIVLGPQRLPEAARTVGKVMSEVRKLSSGFQNEMRAAIQDTSQPSASAERRDVLGGGTAPPTDPGVDAAIAAVSGEPSPNGHDPATSAGPTTTAGGAVSGNGAEAARPSRPPRPRRTRPLQAGDVPAGDGDGGSGS